VLVLFILVLVISSLVLVNFPIKNSDREALKTSFLDSQEKENIYSNKDLSFEISFDKEIEVQEDSEEAFNKRATGAATKTGDFRKNFRSYIGYEPAAFLGAVVLLDKTKSYEINPLTIWVFENPKNLTVDKWYKDYWYYPFVWGDFTSRRNNVAPTQDATISGQLAKSGIVSYQPGEPKFIYLPHNDKMYLFRIIGEDSEEILQSFKFIEKPTSRFCAQVITPARNLGTGRCQTFPDSCIPEGWVVDRVNCKEDL